MSALHPLRPPGVDQPLRRLGARSVEAVERAGRHVAVELRAVGKLGRAQPVEDLQRQAGRIGRRLDHQRRHGRDQYDLGHAPRAVAAEIARHFAAAGGEAHQDGVPQVEGFDHRGEIVGIVIHVIALPRLAGAAMATAIMRHGAETRAGHEQHLRLPAIGTQRPAMTEHHGPTRSPILVVELRAVAGGDVAAVRLARCRGAGPLGSLCGFGAAGKAGGHQRGGCGGATEQQVTA
ncbi:hypothetical protein D3C72_1310830 [compost metagenome]